MSILHIGTRRVDLERGEVEGRGALARRELSLLKYFLDHRDRMIAQDELLREVWGYSPQVRTRALYTAVYRLRSLLEDDPANPRIITAERGEGYQFTIPRAVTEPRPVRAMGPLFGREALLERIRSALATARLVTLTGPPGVGKTRLAREIAAAEGERPVVWVGEGSARPVGEALVIVDRADPAALDALLASSPAARALVTSWGPLHGVDECVVPVGPLGLDAAVALLLARVGPAPADPDAARALAARVGGIPLAVEGVAAMVRTLGWSATSDLLDQSLARIRAGESPRRPGMAAAVASAWAALDPADQRQLLALTPFRGGFTLDAALAVPGDGAAAGVARLRERSWVHLQDDRFRVHDVIRDLVEDMAGPEALAAGRLDHARWVGSALAHLDPGRERANVEAALEARLAAREGGDAEPLILWLDQANGDSNALLGYARRAALLAPDDEARTRVECLAARHLRRVGRYAEALEMAEQAAARSSSPATRARALHQVAEGIFAAGEWSRGPAVVRALGDLVPHLEPNEAVIVRLAVARLVASDDAAAAIRLVDELRDEVGVEHRAWAYGEVIRALAQMRIDPQRAEAHLVWLEDWHERRGMYTRGLRAARMHLLVRQGRASEARALAEKIPGPRHAFDDLLDGWMAWLEGDPEACEDALDRAANRADALHDPYTESMALAALGQLARRSGRWAVAESLMRGAAARHAGHRAEIGAWLVAVAANHEPAEATRALGAADPRALGTRCARWTLGLERDLPALPHEHELLDRIGLEVTVALQCAG